MMECMTYDAKIDADADKLIASLKSKDWTTAKNIVLTDESLG